MGDMKASITLGVQAEIENLQQIRQQLQDALQHVNPDTKKYSSLNKMLQKTAQALQQLAIDSEKPFSKQSQIDSFENKFLNVSGALAQIGRELSNIDFSQLKLTEEQQNEFNKLEKDLENAQKAASNLSTDKLKIMVQDSQELANSLQEFGVNVNTDTLESAFDKINNQITKMIQRFNELETKKQEALSNVDTAKTKTNNAERFLRFLQADNKTDQYNAAPEMFTKNGKYLGAGMKSNTRDNFLRSLGFDEDTIKEIGERGSKNLEELQEKLITATEEAIKRLRAEQEKVEKATEKTITSIDAKEQTQQAQIDRARAAQDIIQTTKDAEGPGSYKESQEKATKNIEAREKALDDFKAAAVEAAPAVKKAAEANEQLDSSMESLRGKTEGASESLSHLTERAEKLNTIKNAIANWMGFYQVLNLIRNAVRYVIEDIRGLDKVMTEIAVVTNMTQKDLWAQMNTYQAIAREYAVSTQGVYQVSQIYYQQGISNI